MVNTILALNQAEYLMKLPLKEAYFNELDSVYSASYGSKSLLIGYDNALLGFQNLPLEVLTVSERYCRAVPQFDFSIFKEDDFRNSNETFSFVGPRLNSISPEFVTIETYPLFDALMSFTTLVEIGSLVKLHFSNAVGIDNIGITHEVTVDCVLGYNTRDISALLPFDPPSINFVRFQRLDTMNYSQWFFIAYVR